MAGGSEVDTVPGNGTPDHVALLGAELSAGRRGGGSGRETRSVALLLLVLEALLKLVERALEVLAAKSTDVLSRSRVDVGHKDVHELAVDSLDTDLVVVARRESMALGLGGDDLDSSITAEVGGVERHVVERKVSRLGVLLDGVGDIQSSGAESAS